VIKKTRTRPVPAAILATWQGQTRPIIVDVDTVVRDELHVCADERGGVRAPRNELATLAHQQEKAAFQRLNSTYGN
jgi:replicative superfamily II helicase